MARSLPIATFLHHPGVLLDVRSPAEYAQGHIPGAVSFPLFSDAERAQVGTCYKQVGREAAIELGLELVGPKLAAFVRQAKDLAPDRTVRLHCWRGGMRSSSMAWLLETAGLSVTLLTGGYKAFRRWVRETLAVPKPVLTLGGMTGTGKTAVLHALAERGAQILDLEALANHRGSSYGGVGLPPQPSTEQFENRLAWGWSQLGYQAPVWIEAEGRLVGTCHVPSELFQQMVKAPVLQIERSRPERIDWLLQDYGTADRAALITATERLRKRLGLQRVKTAVAAIEQGDLARAIEIVLDYYDKTYLYDLERRQVPVYPLAAAGLSIGTIADRLLQLAAEMHPGPVTAAAKLPVSRYAQT